MKRTVSACIAFGLLLGACGDSASSSSDTSIIPPVATTTTAVTTTTVAALTNPPSGEKLISCDAMAVGASYGEKVRLERCTPTWAYGDTDRDSWNCPDEGCAQTRLFHLENDKWVNTATCRRTLPLTRYATSCYVPNVGAATLNLIPPSDVACLMWPANTFLKFTGETGCTPSKADIAAQMAGKCSGYFAAIEFPVEKCDSGRAVRLMQERLKKAGYSTSVDGYFGPGTAKAVFEFQGKNNLPRTGMIDKATWLALEPEQSRLPGKDTDKDGVVSPGELN